MLVSEELESSIAAGAGLRRTGIQHCMVSEVLASMQYIDMCYVMNISIYVYIYLYMNFND